MQNPLISPQIPRHLLYLHNHHRSLPPNQQNHPKMQLPSLYPTPLSPAPSPERRFTTCALPLPAAPPHPLHSLSSALESQMSLARRKKPGLPSLPNQRLQVTRTRPLRPRSSDGVVVASQGLDRVTIIAGRRFRRNAKRDYVDGWTLARSNALMCTSFPLVGWRVNCCLR